MRLTIVQDALSATESAALPSEAVPPMPPTVTQAGITKDQAQVLPVAWGRVRVGTSTVGDHDGIAGTAARAAATGAEEGERPVHALFEPGQEPSASAVLPPRQSMDL
jgi:hypothetical protein